MDDFGIGMDEGTPTGAMEDQKDGQALKTMFKNTATGIEGMDFSGGDGMKTAEAIKTYDPIANPMDNPLQNKQGVGSAGYDYSDVMTNPDRE
jgi:hypothetical protein